MRAMDVEYVEADQNQEFPDISDISADFYTAAAAAAEQDFQQFEQTRIINEHGYSMCPKKQAKLGSNNDQNYNSVALMQRYPQAPAGFQLLERAANKISGRVFGKGGSILEISDTDSGDDSPGDLYGVENRQRRRVKKGHADPNNGAFNRNDGINNLPVLNRNDIRDQIGGIYGFSSYHNLGNGQESNDIGSDSSDDSDISPLSGVRNGVGAGFPPVSAGSGSSDNDFLPTRESEEAAMLLLTDPKSETEDQLDPSQIGAFKTFSSSDRKSASSLFKKSSERQATGPGLGKKGRKSTNIKKRGDGKTGAKKVSVPSKAAKIRTLFKASPSKHGAVKSTAKSKNKTVNEKVAKAKKNILNKVSKAKAGLKKKTSTIAREKLPSARKGVKSKADNILYCICRKPHSGRFMICCDRCDQWFHGSCVRVTAVEGKSLAKSKADYICPPCKLKEQQVNAGPRRTTERTQRMSLHLGDSIKDNLVNSASSPVLTPVSTDAPQVRSATLLATNVHDFLEVKKAAAQGATKKSVVIRKNMAAVDSVSPTRNAIPKSPRATKHEEAMLQNDSLRTSGRRTRGYDSGTDSSEVTSQKEDSTRPSSSKRKTAYKSEADSEARDEVAAKTPRKSPVKDDSCQEPLKSVASPRKSTRSSAPVSEHDSDVPKVSPAGIEKNKSKIIQRAAVLKNSRLLNKNKEPVKTKKEEEKDQKSNESKDSSITKKQPPKRGDDGGAGGSGSGSTSGGSSQDKDNSPRGGSKGKKDNSNSNAKSQPKRSSPRKRQDNFEPQETICAFSSCEKSNALFDTQFSLQISFDCIMMERLSCCLLTSEANFPNCRDAVSSLSVKISLLLFLAVSLYFIRRFLQDVASEKRCHETLQKYATPGQPSTFTFQKYIESFFTQCCSISPPTCFFPHHETPQVNSMETHTWNRHQNIYSSFSVTSTESIVFC